MRYLRLLYRYITALLCFGFTGCTTVVAGKKASVYGCVLLGHNEDNGSEESELYKVPYKDHLRGDIAVTKEGGMIPQAERTLAYLWSETPRESFCDFYLNQCGVAVTNNMSFSKLNDMDAMKRTGQLSDGGIDYWLSRLISERSSSARDGVEIFQSLINRFGYNVGGRVYVIADRNEAWVICAAAGKHYFARRVPDDEVVIVPNSYTSGDLSRTTSDDVIYSPDLVKDAETYGFFDSRKGPFRFDLAFGADGQGILSERGFDIRMWVGQRALLGYDPERRELPFSVKPAEPMDMDKMKRLLRDHNEGTEFDVTGNYGMTPHRSGDSTICRHDTKKSIIAQFRDGKPEGQDAVMWMAMRNPCSSIYVPFYIGAESVPGIYGSIDHAEAIATHFNRSTANTNYSWKVFSELKEVTDSKYGAVIGTLKAEIEAFEKGIDEKMTVFENDAAIADLSGFTEDIADMACIKGSQLTDMMIRGDI
jgi:dipeptidase